MKGLKVILLSCAIVYPLTSITETQIALADTPISSCINSLLYKKDDWGGANRTEISEQTVENVCREVTTQEEASSVKSCVKSLLYRKDSRGGVERTETSEETAVGACAISRNTPTNTVPGLATPNSNSCLISTGVPIGNETGTPEPKPRLTNPIESRIMAMTKAEDLVRELNSVRSNYQKWADDSMALKTQTRLAQIIHLRSQQIGSCLN